MTENIPGAQDGLAAYIQFKRPGHTTEQLVQEFLDVGNALRKEKGIRKITLKGAQKTVTSALAGKGLYKISCEIFAKMFDCDPEEICKRAPIRRLSGSAVVHEEGLGVVRDVATRSRMRSYDSWQDPEIQRLLESAKDTIVFVDSWFDEGSYFAGRLRQRKRLLGDRRLRLTIYLLSDIALGGQRLKAIAAGGDKKRKERSDDKYKDEYARSFRSGMDSMEHNLNDPSVEVEVYHYSVMPGMRLLIIDDTVYVFGWFPLGTVSASNVCFCVSADDGTDDGNMVIKHLKEQMEALQAVSEKIETLGSSD